MICLYQQRYSWGEGNLDWAVGRRKISIDSIVAVDYQPLLLLTLVFLTSLDTDLPRTLPSRLLHPAFWVSFQRAYAKMVPFPKMYLSESEPLFRIVLSHYKNRYPSPTSNITVAHCHIALGWNTATASYEKTISMIKQRPLSHRASCPSLLERYFC